MGNQCVNTTTGEYFDFQTDITIPGSEGLSQQRFIVVKTEIFLILLLYGNLSRHLYFQAKGLE